MNNIAWCVSLSGACVLAFALSVGCSSSTDSGSGAMAAAGAAAERGRVSSDGGSSVAGTGGGGVTWGSGGTQSNIGGSTAIAGTSGDWTANGGGESSSAGAAGSSSAGASGTNGDCAALATEATCKAASACYPIYSILPCPNSGGTCPSAFSSCADTGCGTSCGAGSVCVGVTVSGGAVALPDAGACPLGFQLTGQLCQHTPSTTFSCKPAPAACNGKVDCACTTPLCGTCQSSEHNQIDCVEYVP